MMTKLSQATCEREQPIGASPTSTCARATASPFRWRAGVSDVAAASLVIFFNPDPVRTLGRWVEFVRRGGRIGLTSFGRVDQAWQQADGRTVAINPPPTPILRMAYEIADLLDASTHWASSIANKHVGLFAEPFQYRQERRTENSWFDRVALVGRPHQRHVDRLLLPGRQGVEHMSRDS